MGFRDCMEEKKGRMLDMEAEEVGDIQGEICSGLKVSQKSLVLFFCFYCLPTLDHQGSLLSISYHKKYIWFGFICISCISPNAQGCF